jgi:NAD(P)-dependent dehydrogenase (short-subunit alcohol dehydrogenase family)
VEIKGQAAIVTGGASGLGRATAARLNQAGARVAILDLDDARVARAAEELGVLGLACDVTDAQAAERAVAAARETQGPARILVCCAGIATGGRIVAKDGPMPLEDFELAVRVNLIGTFNLLRLAAADMAELEPLAGGERGVIVTTASIAAYEGQIGQAAYAASKAGVVGLVLPAARELARHGIRVLGVAPGIFATPMLAGLPDEVQAALSKDVPFPARLGEPAEFAALVEHLTRNPMLNGTTVRLDAALRLAPR